MNPRFTAIQKASRTTYRSAFTKEEPDSTIFASRVFHLRLMENTLPKKVFQHLTAVMEGKEKLDPQWSDAVADAFKTWAVQLGATHYTHWFQPLTGGFATKHDAFLSFSGTGAVIEQLRGQDLLRSEPDASSFPSGGLRATHEARGYTAWDPSSPPFLWEGGDGLTLCIPSVYFSWTGEALDQKIPLLRSEEKIQVATLRLLKRCGLFAERVISTLGPEQEYFAIDRHLFLLRPDLMFSGRTVCGAPPSKGQEMEDHYFGSIKHRVLAFMHAFEEAAIRLGIPVKTRHNEVAPAQHEVAPLFERTSLAVDHNLLLMELMKQTAAQHNLACLFHEKPFAGINGSGKHCNWSLATDTGINLLDPKTHRFAFLTLLTAVISAVHEHAGLLRASIASLGNDYRLGGSEAPPTILSVYLGEALEQLIADILSDKPGDAQVARRIDLGLSSLSSYEIDPSDRNRTSFFAFTGNKFEFRAVGASAHCAFPVTVIHAIVADTLTLILDEMDDVIRDHKDLDPEALFALTLPVLRKALLRAQPVLFGGNAYSVEWEKEAENRGLPNFKRGYHSLSQLLDKKSLRAFAGIFNEKELHSRYEILLEQYAKSMHVEASLMIDLFRTQILPAALLDQKARGEALLPLKELSLKTDMLQSQMLQEWVHLIDQAIHAIDEVAKVQRQTFDLGWEAKAKVFCEIVAVKMAQARALIDQLERRMDNTLWPLPKYQELLYYI